MERFWALEFEDSRDQGYVPNPRVLLEKVAQ